MSTATPPADAATGRELGGPMSGSGTHSPPVSGGPAPGGTAVTAPGRGPICSRAGSGGAVMPSTTTSVTSGAASCTAPSIASRTVTVEEGQPWQVPSSRRRATPSRTPRYCTPPACEPRYGRTWSSARWIRSSTSSGCSPCSNSRPSTSGSAVSRSTMARPGSPSWARAAMMAARPSPYIPTSRRTSSSAVSAAAPPRARSAARSSSIRSPACATLVIGPRFLGSRGTAPNGTARPQASGGQGDRHRRVHLFQLLPTAEVHVHATGQAWVEAADRAHDIDALESVRRVLLEDRRVLHRILVRPGRAVDVADAGVPRSRRVRVVVGDLPTADHHVVRQHPAHRLGEPATVRFVGDAERLPRLGAPGPDLGQRLLGEVQRARRRVGLEVGAGPVALDRVGQRRTVLIGGHLPLERHLGPADRAGQVDQHAVAGGLDIAEVDKPAERRRPEPGNRAAAGVRGQVVGAVEPARGHDP